MGTKLENEFERKLKRKSKGLGAGGTMDEIVEICKNLYCQGHYMRKHFYCRYIVCCHYSYCVYLCVHGHRCLHKMSPRRMDPRARYLGDNPGPAPSTLPVDTESRAN